MAELILGVVAITALLCAIDETLKRKRLERELYEMRRVLINGQGEDEPR